MAALCATLAPCVGAAFTRSSAGHRGERGTWRKLFGVGLCQVDANARAEPARGQKKKRSESLLHHNKPQTITRTREVNQIQIHDKYTDLFNFCTVLIKWKKKII